jgi:hypothetical protein
MQESLEFATAVADTVSFFLVTTDLHGKERLADAGERLQRTADRLAYALEISAENIRERLLLLGGIFAAVFVLGVLALILLYAVSSGHGSSITFGVMGRVATVAVWAYGIGFFLSIASTVVNAVLTGGAFLLAGLLAVLKRYSFNGVLLGIGTVIFLASRGITMYDTWPHSLHGATAVSHEHGETRGPGHPADLSGARWTGS